MKTNITITKMGFYLFAISFFGFINFSNAQATWKGAVNTDFYNVKNWDNTSIDFNNLTDTDIIIGAGSPNNPINIGNKGSDKIIKRPRTLTTNVGANIIIVNDFYPNGLSNLNGTITVDGDDAKFNIRSQAYVGKGASGILNINKGKVIIKNTLFIGNGTGADGLVTVNTGSFLVLENSLEIGTGSGIPTGNLRIKGGTVNIESSLTIGINGHISISEKGKLIVNGNKEEVLTALVKSRTIGCTVGKKLEVIFDGTKTTVSIKEVAAAVAK